MKIFQIASQIASIFADFGPRCLDFGNPRHLYALGLTRLLGCLISHYNVTIIGELQGPPEHDLVLEVVDVSISEEDEGAHLILPILIELLELSRLDNRMRRIKCLSKVHPAVLMFQ